MMPEDNNSTAFLLPQQSQLAGCPPVVRLLQPLPAPSDTEKQWFVLRTTYCREAKFQEYCKEKGLEHFLPMRFSMKKIQRNGKTYKRRVTTPAIHNIIFIHESQEQLDELIFSHRFDYLRYYYDKATNTPLVVPDKQMRHFMAVASIDDSDTVWLTDSSTAYSVGDRVRITQGAFAGIEGNVKRVKGQQRVIVSLPHLFAIATAYIPTAFMEKME